MKVLHISTECYPAAKAGGMADVVGALPNYLPKFDIEASVIIPKYKNKWISSQKWKTIRSFYLQLGTTNYVCNIESLERTELAYPLYVLDIKGLFDRASIYLDDNGEAYADETARYLAFQRGVLDWLLLENKFDLLHCHDHMTGLITFMIKHSPRYQTLSHLPTIFTIHNGQYRGVMDWKIRDWLPTFDDRDAGLLDWDGYVQGLATAIKCSNFVTTVSPSYLDELSTSSDNISGLLAKESTKSLGILNGIDDTLWDPKTDPLIAHKLKKKISNFKNKNKQELADEYRFDSKRILIGFIGRFARQKGADLLAAAYDIYLQDNTEIHFFILGSGDKGLENDITELQKKHPENITTVIAYNEKLAHQVYAASDFIIMPSRFEPCGLNQFYAMRYGAIPVVRKTGGLSDSIIDIGDEGGYGITFLRDTSADILYSLDRIVALHGNEKSMSSLRESVMQLDFSWTKSVEEYSLIYQKIYNEKH